MPGGLGRAGRQVGHSHSVCRQLQQLPGVELQAQLAELRAREGMDALAGREQMRAERGRAGVPGERGGAGYSRSSAAEVYNSRQIWILVIGPRLNECQE